MTEAAFRNDGIPYANARASHPGIIIAFESKFGPLKFAVDTFWKWDPVNGLLKNAQKALCEAKPPPKPLGPDAH